MIKRKCFETAYSFKKITVTGRSLFGKESTSEVTIKKTFDEVLSEFTDFVNTLPPENVISISEYGLDDGDGQYFNIKFVVWYRD